MCKILGHISLCFILLMTENYANEKMALIIFKKSVARTFHNKMIARFCGLHWLTKDVNFFEVSSSINHAKENIALTYNAQSNRTVHFHVSFRNDWCSRWYKAVSNLYILYFGIYGQSQKEIKALSQFCRMSHFYEKAYCNMVIIAQCYLNIAFAC